jgi:hypothetical protein
VVTTPIPDIKTFVFDRVTEGARLSRQILDADRKAATVKNAAGQFVYDDAYYVRFFQSAKPVLETRVASAVNSVASVWVQAWIDAGRPALNSTRVVGN